MGSINYGNQQISFEYNERLRGAEANELLTGVIRPGPVTWPGLTDNSINTNPLYYSSQLLTIQNGPNFNGNELIIKPFTAILSCPGPFGERITVKVTTTTDVAIDGTGIPTPTLNLFTSNYICMEYTWSESPGNFADISIVSSVGPGVNIPPNAIILGAYYTDKFGQFVFFVSTPTGGLNSQFQNPNTYPVGGPLFVDNGDYADTLVNKVLAGTNVSVAVETNPPPVTSIYYNQPISSYKQFRINSLDEKVKVSANDTTPSSLQSKLTADSNFTWTVLNPGGNEQLQLQFAGSLQFDKIKISASDTVNDYLYNSVVTDTYLSKAIQNPGADEKLLISNLRPGHKIVSPTSGLMAQRTKVSYFGYGFTLADNGGLDSTDITFGARTVSHAPTLGTMNIDLESAEVHYVDLQAVPGGALVITLTNIFNDGKTVLIKFAQGAIPVTLSFSNTIKWRGGAPSFTISPNAIDMVSIFFDGSTSTIFGLAALNFT